MRIIRVLLGGALLAAPPLAAQSVADLATRLAGMTAVTGYEHAMADSVMQLLPGAGFDRAGDVVLTLGSGSPRRLVACALDEPGYVVGGVTGEGYITIRRVGRPPYPLFDQGMAGHRATVWTRTGSVPAVIAIPSLHLSRARRTEEAPFTSDELYVDVGATTVAQVEGLGVQQVDPVAAAKDPWRFTHYLAAPVAAQRASCAALASAALGAKRPKGTVVVAFAVESWLGNRGFLTLTNTAGPFSDVLLLGFPNGAAVRGVTNWIPAVEHAGTNVETVDLNALPAFAARVGAWIAGTTAPPAGAGPAAMTPPAIGAVPHVPADQSPVNQAAALLGELVETYGVSGDEREVRKAVERQLPSWAKPEVDTAGNVWVRVGQGGAPDVFVAHMDEVGFVVQKIDGDGTITLGTQGGVFPWLWEATPALVKTGAGMVPGIFLPRDSVGRSPGRFAAGPMRLSVGAASAPEVTSLGVEVGQRVTNPKHFVRLAGTRATGRSFDDRAGCVAQILALRDLDRSKLTHQVIFLFVTREEIGLEGSAAAARALGTTPAHVYAIDTFVSSDGPFDLRTFAYQRIGEGPVARMVDNSSVTPTVLVDSLRQVVARRGLPLQVGTTNGGNDGSSFQGWGVPDIPIGWPLHYSHSPVEVIDLKDVVALAGVLRAIAETW